MPGVTAAPAPAPAGRRLGVVLLFGQALAGLAVGVVWWALTRHPAPWVVGEPVVTSGAVYPIARDGVFSVLTGLVGLAAAVVVVTRGRQRPVLALGTALAGALASALLALGVGGALPPSDATDVAHVTVHAGIVLLVQPFVVAAAVALVTLVDALWHWARTG
ncbi:hypothetical protein [Kineococcus sp. SYSU DK002]|uniref:hypothetical protein n=1 Tax=Kineococcus sp. SYSU DK002 TaxID=3383123 RepID=UPI003D7C63D0